MVNRLVDQQMLKMVHVIDTAEVHRGTLLQRQGLLILKIRSSSEGSSLASVAAARSMLKLEGSSRQYRGGTSFSAWTWSQAISDSSAKKSSR
jgi:hypothetical protein